MTENFPFRSSMSGFNRNDVIQYIDEMFAEKAKAENRIAELEKEVNALKTDNANLRHIIDEQSEKINSASKCNECEIVKVYEARLGAAMLDAKRFSEILVKEANDKAASLFADAFASADKTSVKAKDIAHNISEINKQFDISFKLLLDNMNMLGKSLESFKSEVKATGDMFDFSTDFLPISADNKYISETGTEPFIAPDTVSVPSQGMPSTISSSFDFDMPQTVKLSSDSTEDSSSGEGVGPVNFDDADEFDIRVDVNV